VASEQAVFGSPEGSIIDIHPNMAQFTEGVVDWTQARLPDGTLWRP
jgi:hypothetical protein